MNLYYIEIFWHLMQRTAYFMQEFHENKCSHPHMQQATYCIIYWFKFILTSPYDFKIQTKINFQNTHKFSASMKIKEVYMLTCSPNKIDHICKTTLWWTTNSLFIHAKEFKTRNTITGNWTDIICLKTDPTNSYWNNFWKRRINVMTLKYV